MGANVNCQNAVSITQGHQIIGIAKEHGEILFEELELYEIRLKAFEKY